MTVPSSKVGSYTLNNTPNVSDTQAPTGQWGQITAGPQAIAYKSILQIIYTLETIQQMYQKQAADQAKASGLAAKASAEATRAAAKFQANQTYCEMGQSFAGAAVSIGGIGATWYKTKDLDTQMTTLETQNRNIGILQDKLKANPTASISAGQQSPTNIDSAIRDRIQELLTPGADYAAFKKTPAEGDDINEKALAHMSAEELGEFKENLRLAYDSHSKLINNNHTQQQTAQSKVQMYQGIASGAVNGAFQAGQATCQTNQGTQQAASAITNNIAQQSSNMFSTNQGFIGKFYDEAMQSLSMLQQLAAAASVRG